MGMPVKRMKRIIVAMPVESEERARRLADRCPISRAAILRASIRLGLDVLERDPSAILALDGAPRPAA